MNAVDTDDYYSPQSSDEISDVEIDGHRVEVGDTVKDLVDYIFEMLDC